MPMTLVRHWEDVDGLARAAGQTAEKNIFQPKSNLGVLPPGMWHLIFPVVEVAIVQSVGSGLLTVDMWVNTDPLFYDDWRIEVTTTRGAVTPARLARPQVGILALIAVIALAMAIVAAAIAVTVIVLKVPGAARALASPWLWAGVGVAALGFLVLAQKSKQLVS